MPYSMSPDNGRVNRVERLIINLDMQMPSMCDWADCDRRARTSYQLRLHEHMPKRCSTVDAAGGAYGRHTIMKFCSQDCMDYWAWSTGWRAHVLADAYNGRIYGMKPPGSRAGRYR